MPVLKNPPLPATSPASGIPREPNDISGFAALGIILAVCIVMFADLLLGRSKFVISSPDTDLANYFLHSREFGFTQLARGNLALWNPYLFSGVPFLGGFQTGLLYPPNWIHLLLPRGTALNLEVAGHMLMLGILMLLWARRTSGSWMGGTLAAVVVMLGAPAYLHIYAGHLTLNAAFAWIPLILLMLDWVIERASFGAAWIISLAVAMQVYAGHPQTLYATGLATGIYFLLRLPDSQTRLRSAILFLGATVAGLLLGAWQILTAVSTEAESTRSGALAYADAASFSLSPLNLLTFVAPWLLGKESYTGPESANVYVGPYYMWEMCVYVGVGTLLLILLGVLRSPDRRRWKLACLAAIFITLALGSNTPIHRWFYEILPGFNRFRGVCKFSGQALIFLAMLAALGWNVLAMRLGRWQPIVLLMSVLGCLCGIGAFSIFLTSLGDSGGLWGLLLSKVHESGLSYLPSELFSKADFVRTSANQAVRSLLVAGGLIGTNAILIWIHSTRAPRAANMLAALLILDLLAFARGARPSFELASKLETKSFAEIRASLATNERLLVLGGIENACMSHGIHSIWGYDPQVPRRYAEWMFWTQGEDPEKASYSLRFRNLGPPHDLLRCGRLLAEREGRLTLQGKASSMPRAFFCSNFEVVPRRDALFAKLRQYETNPRERVFLETDPGIANSPQAGNATVEVIEHATDATDRLTVQIEAPRAGVVVITDSYSSGWRVLSPKPDGGSYKIVPVNHTLLGIPVNQGSHQIELQYAPPGESWGKWITGLASLGFALLGVWRIRRNGLRFVRAVADDVGLRA